MHNEIKEAIENYHQGTLTAVNDLREDFDQLKNDMAPRDSRRPLMPDTNTEEAENSDPSRFFAKVGDQRIPILNNTEKLSAFYHPPSNDGENIFSLSDYVRGCMGFQNAVTTGPALVPTYTGVQIIDAVRAASVLIEAGSGTINIEGPTNLAKITGDPTVYQHTEGNEDIDDSVPTIVPVEVDPKALVAAIPLSAEVVQDSPNLDAVLTTSIAGAFASKLDTLGLAKILADTNIPTSSAAQDPAAWADTLAAISEALAADQGLPSAMISSPADFMARASQTASTAGSWLGKPPVLSRMAELFTSSVSDGTAIFGDFLRGFAIAVRQELRVEVIRFSNYKSYSHVLLAHSRMDGYTLQPGHLFIQKETV